MYIFKRIDCGIQAFLILGGILVCFNYEFLTTEFMSVFFVVGGWQMISVLVHARWYRPPVKSQMRKVYLWALAILVGLVLPLSFTPLLLVALMGLLAGSSILAILYLITCLGELNEDIPQQEESTTP